MKRIIFIFYIMLQPCIMQGQIANFMDCNASLIGDTLILENNKISRTYLWKNGHISTLRFVDKKNNYTWIFNGDEPDLFFPDLPATTNGKIEFDNVEGNSISHPHLKVTIYSSFGTLNVKRIFNLYSGISSITCHIFLKGNYKDEWTKYSKKGRVTTPVFERILANGVHWNVKTIAFTDQTDDNNNLVSETNQLVFTRQSRLKGNIIWAEQQLGESSIFILKESPNADAQIGYPGCDFVIKQSEDHYLDLQVVGLNILPSEICEDKWTRCSGYVTGVSMKDELSRLFVLREYQNTIRVKLPERDEMIMMNTWGDRGQDANINHDFCINEINAGKKLGITHFQLDDGWQTGRTANSAHKGGSLDDIWIKSNYWTVDSQKFPQGLRPIVDYALKNDIQVGLWFNPSHDNSYANWERDAEVLIDLYHQYGIKTFKIDGLIIPNKIAEINFRKFLDTILHASNNEIVINLDVTGLAKRPGYHYFNEYGNIFLENRYSDWVNYYPHWTLRNLWMLSKYVPAQNLQIEFLNPWRNADLYKQDDIFAPANIPFDYQVVSTLIAQPLAWLEGSQLPEKSMSVGPLIRKYRKFMNELHNGLILPIGDEPSGNSWTGFQSIKSDSTGYLLILKEHNQSNIEKIKTWLPENTNVELVNILGNGRNTSLRTEKDGIIEVKIKGNWTYVLYEYEIQ